MYSLRTIPQMARADLLERVRRYSFLFMLLGAAWLAYTVFADYWRFRISEEFRIALGPVRTGTMVALATNLVLSFAGFYLVKGTVTRDRLTGVGQILHTTSMKRWEYAAGKYLSNMGVLLSMAAVLASTAVVFSWLQEGMISLSITWDVLSPFLLLTVPVLFMLAGLALLFDSIPLLDGAFGNVLYLFFWIGLFMISESWPSFDMIGFNTAIQYVQEALAAAQPDANIDTYAFQIRTAEQAELKGFDWSGLPWNMQTVGTRLNLVTAGLLLPGISAVFLYLFDPFNREGSASADNREADSYSAKEESGHIPNGSVFSGLDLTPVRSAGLLRGFFTRVIAEFRLLYRGHSWWWYLGLILVNGVIFTGEVSIALLVVWLLPLTAWSSLGCREQYHGTGQILFSCPFPRGRQLPVQLVAGVIFTLLAAVGPAGYFILTGDTAALGAFAAGAFFIPALAIFLGVWTGNPKTFEAVYLLLWYIGPLNEIPVLDFMGFYGNYRSCHRYRHACLGHWFGILTYLFVMDRPGIENGGISRLRF